MDRDRLRGFGESQYALTERLLADPNPPNMEASLAALAADADYDVYPNTAEPAAWWRLGNLKTDGVDAVLKAYRDGSTPGMTANRTIPISELARRYGDPSGKKLYTKNDLIARFMHQWGEDYMKGKI